MVRNHRRTAAKILLSMPDVVSNKADLDESTTDNCWDTFCQETTLGGFPNLLPDIHPARRIFWYLVCATFTIITAYQIILLFSGYVDNPIKTTTTQSYPGIIIFPVVAICNTMPFRSSAVHPLSEMHSFLDAYYSSTVKRTRESFSLGELEALSQVTNTTQFYSHVAHQKEDMIISCKWQNTPCGPENFTTIVTEGGVCYAFNYESTNAKVVTQPGESYGLQMTLNVATYEEMVGPYVNFGILVKVFPQGYPLLSQGSVYALLGLYTSISLTRKDVTFLRDYNCDEKELQMYDVYTRAACMRENIFELVYNNCSCYPHGTPESEYTAGKDRCNLEREFFCAGPILGFLDESNNYSESECPRECNIQTYTPIVSSAKVAWPRTLKLSDQTSGNITENLKKAQESGKRYKPADKIRTNEIFQDLQSSIAELLNLIGILDNRSYQIPPLTGTENYANLPEKLENFRLKSYRKLMTSLTRSLDSFTNSTHATLTAFQDVLLLGTGDQHQLVANWTAEDLAKLFLHKIGSQLHLITLPSVVTLLEDLDKVKVDLEAGIQVAFGLASEGGILAQSVQLHLRDTTDDFVSLLTTPLKLEGYGSGCLQHQFKSDVNNLSHPILFDVYLCLVHRYSSTNTQISLAVPMANMMVELKTNQLEVQQQLDVCNKLLCEAAHFEDESNCSLTVDEMRNFTRHLHTVMVESIDDCSKQLARAQEDFELFVNDYQSRLLANYNWAAQLAMAIRQNYSKIRDLFGRPFNNHKATLETLSANMTAYKLGNMSYEDFSVMFVRTFKIWQDAFTFDYNTFKQTLQQGLTTFSLIRPDLLQLLNFSESSTDSSEVLAMLNPLINSYLWRNGSIGSIEETFERLERLQNVSQPFLSRLTAALEGFNVAMKTISDDTKLFLEKIAVKPDFYENNFMVVNVHMQSISIDSVGQDYAVNFWNLIADLGGAASFWLGLCMITFVEILDVGVRYGFKCFRCGIQRFRARNWRPPVIQPSSKVQPNETYETSH